MARIAPAIEIRLAGVNCFLMVVILPQEALSFVYRKNFITSLEEQTSIDLHELIALLNEDRALILEKIDQGCWPELRHDLAAMERELGKFLDLVSVKIDS